VLVVDLHTLQTVYLLYLIHNVFLNSRWAFDHQDICWCDGSFRKRCASFYEIVLLNKNVLAQWCKILAHLACAGLDADLAVTAFHFTVGHDTVHLRHNRWVGWVTGFEQLGDTWKTTRDVTRFTRYTWNLNKRFTCLHFLTM